MRGWSAYVAEGSCPGAEGKGRTGGVERRLRLQAQTEHTEVAVGGPAWGPCKGLRLVQMRSDIRKEPSVGSWKQGKGYIGLPTGILMSPEQGNGGAGVMCLPQGVQGQESVKEVLAGVYARWMGACSREVTRDPQGGGDPRTF